MNINEIPSKFSYENISSHLKIACQLCIFTGRKTTVAMVIYKKVKVKLFCFHLCFS